MRWRRDALLLTLLVFAAPATGAELPQLAGMAVSGWAVAEAGANGGTGQSATGTAAIAHCPISRSAGAAELTDDGRIVRPLRADTPVRIASVSKVVVALAINRLADQGQLGLDDDASLHLGWRLRHPAFPDTPVTVRMVLRHEGSLSDKGGYGGRLGERLRDTISPASWNEARPGTAFDYSNLNSALLAEIVEKLTGERFDRAARRLVLEPLGVAACFNWSSCPPGLAESGAVLYRKSPDQGESWLPDGPWVAQVDAERPAGQCPVQRVAGMDCKLDDYRAGTNGGLFSPQGGLRISVLELARLGAAVLANRGEFLRSETHQALFRPVAVRPPPADAGEETDPGLMRFWSEGGLHCFAGPQAPRTASPGPAGWSGCGHLGEAYGLFSALVMDPGTQRVRAHALTGTSDRPPPGRVPGYNALEEALAAVKP